MKCQKPCPYEPTHTLIKDMAKFRKVVVLAFKIKGGVNSNYIQMNFYTRKYGMCPRIPVKL